MTTETNRRAGLSVPQWYAVYTRSKAEKKAADELLRKGIECYLPIRKVRKTWGKRSRVVDFPLISCYIFVRVDYRRYYDALMVSGVMWYVCFNGQPTTIPDQQIRSLKLIEEKMNEWIVVTSERIDKGDLIEVSEGPLKGFRGEVVRIKGESHFVIRFRTLGCCIHASQDVLDFRVVEKSI